MPNEGMSIFGQGWLETDDEQQAWGRAVVDIGSILYSHVYVNDT